MSEGIIVALITVVIGGLFTLTIRWVDGKANRAKDAVTYTTAEVQNMNTALMGMKVLLDSQQAAYDRQHRLDQEHITELQKDLIEEKSVNLALEKEIDKLRKEKNAIDPAG